MKRKDLFEGVAGFSEPLGWRFLRGKALPQPIRMWRNDGARIGDTREPLELFENPQVPRELRVGHSLAPQEVEKLPAWRSAAGHVVSPRRRLAGMPITPCDT
ncbi:MAG: hypothetical protein JST54_35765 [Deltaproteobacteria bacterium]|nr:hypothetical protein [Deltaproteobacteria bacterium]